MRRYQLTHLKLGDGVTDDILSLLDGMVGESGHVERIQRENTIAVFTTLRNHELVWKYIQVVDVDRQESEGDEIPQEVKDAILEMSSMSESARMITDALASRELELKGLNERLDSIEGAGRKDVWIIGAAVTGAVLLSTIVVVLVIRRMKSGGDGEPSGALAIVREESREYSEQLIASHNATLEASKEDLKRQVVGFVRQLDEAHIRRNEELAGAFSEQLIGFEKRLDQRIVDLLSGVQLGDAGKQLMAQQEDILREIGAAKEGMKDLAAKHNGLNKAAEELRQLYDQLEAREDDLDRKNLEVLRLKDELNQQIREAESAKNTLASLVHILKDDDEVDDDLIAELSGGIDIVSRSIDAAEGEFPDEVGAESSDPAVREIPMPSLVDRSDDLKGGDADGDVEVRPSSSAAAKGEYQFTFVEPSKEG